MNRTRRGVVALTFVSCLILFSGIAFAQSYSQAFREETAEALYQTKGWDTCGARWLIGYQVETAQSDYLGQISSLVIDSTTGRIALVVLSDVPGLGAKEVAIPYNSLTRISEHTFRFNPGNMLIEVASGYSDPYVYAVRRPPGSSDMYGIPSEITSDWVAHVYGHYGQEPYWTEPGEKPHAFFELYPSAILMGAGVQDSKGEEVAQVNDLVIDSSDGHIVFVVFSNIKGRGDSLVAAPFGALSRNPENLFVLNATREQLASAPGFTPDEFAALGSRQKAEDIYRFFGVQPYWTGEVNISDDSMMKQSVPTMQPSNEEKKEVGPMGREQGR